MLWTLEDWAGHVIDPDCIRLPGAKKLEKLNIDTIAGFASTWRDTDRACSGCGELPVAPYRINGSGTSRSNCKRNSHLHPPLNLVAPDTNIRVT